MAKIVKKCPCLRPKIEEEVHILDYRHANLQEVPGEVFNRERTLEELYLDSNQIRDLQRELFHCYGLRKLSCSDNEITCIPPAISSLGYLEMLDFSKNGIIDVPDSIKKCKYLKSVDASINPLGKLPESFTHLSNLTHLYLNDTFLDFLPGSFGRMVKLKILELRDNHIKALPSSFSRLIELERLDIGNNEFTELSDVIGGLKNLLELWCDNNQITTVSPSIYNLKNLMFLDASNNRLQELPQEIFGCLSLADLYLTSNNLTELPDSLGSLSNLITLKVDDNQITYLPKTLGGLSSLSELNVSENDLENLPSSIGLLRNLRTLYADENLLKCLPAELGSCKGITVLSLRSNKLTYIPDELGCIPRLRVLNLSNNILQYLPFSIIRLKQLQALWLTENQTRPLIPLQSEYDPSSGKKILTCYLLPQGQLEDKDEASDDIQSCHSSMWEEERLRHPQIHFAPEEEFNEKRLLVRCPTPHPKEIKARHEQGMAMQKIKTAGSSMRNGDSRAVYGMTRRAEAVDEEKLLKEKSSIKNKLPIPDFGSDLNGILKDMTSRERKMRPAATRLPSYSGSVPNLTTSYDRNVASSMASLGTLPASSNYDNHSSCSATHQDQGGKSRQKRDYDLDTCYHSDHDLSLHRQEFNDNLSFGSNSDILSVQSQPLPYHYKPRSRGRKATGNSNKFEMNSDRDLFKVSSVTLLDFEKRQHEHCQRLLKRKFHTASVSHEDNREKNNICFHSQYNSEPTNSRPSIESVSLFGKVNDLEGNDRIREKYSHSNHSAENLTITGGTCVSTNEFCRYGSHSDQHLTSHVRFNESGFNKIQDETANNHYSSIQVSHDENRVTSLHHCSCSDKQTLNSLHHCSHLEKQTLTLLHHCSHSEKQTPSPLHHCSHSEKQTPTSLAQKQKGLSPVNGGHHEFLSPVLKKPHCIGGNKLFPQQFSPHSRTPLTASYKEDFVHKISSDLNPAAFSLTEATAFCIVSNCHNGNKASSVLKDNQEPKKWPNHNQPTPPATTPCNPLLYRKLSDRANSRPCSGRPSSNASPSHVELLHCAATMNDPSRVILSLAPSPAVEAPNVNQPESLCGFHTQMETPIALSEKLNCSNYAQSDEKSQSHCYSNSSSSSSTLQQHTTDSCPGKSDKNYSQIVSTSQSVPDSHHIEVDLRADEHSDSSVDSQMKVCSHSSCDESPHIRKNRFHDQYSGSSDTGNYEDFAIIPILEQSSQVSSSTDSGYGHGHHLYEQLEDHPKTEKDRCFSKGISDSFGTTAPSSQKQMSAKGSGNDHSTASLRSSRDSTHSTTQEYKDQLRFTIKKSPGLGFSIAGGIGSKGNPFRENDIGIFVTKIVPGGPASKFLQPGDKILEVNKVDFQIIDHNQAVAVLKKNSTVTLLVERIQKMNIQ